MSDQQPEELPAWARKVIARGATVYAAASTTASSISLGHLASQAGHDWARSLLFAVSFECAAAITGTAWVAGRRGGWWHTTGKAATLGLLAASLTFNAAEVLQVQGRLPAGLLLAVAVAVALVFPVGALLFAHLALMVRHVVAASRTDGAAARAATAVLVDQLGHAPLPVREVVREVPVYLQRPDPAGDVPPAGSGDQPEQNATLLERVLADLRAAAAARPPLSDGQRPVAERLGIPRSRAGFAEAHKEAKRLLDLEQADTTHTNGHRVPLPV